MYDDIAIPIDNSKSYTINSSKIKFEACTKKLDINTYLPKS